MLYEKGKLLLQLKLVTIIHNYFHIVSIKGTFYLNAVVDPRSFCEDDPAIFEKASAFE